MSNGCICCTLRDDLLAEVSRLAQERRFDYLLIDQIEFADVIVLNKLDLVSNDQALDVEAIVASHVVSSGESRNDSPGERPEFVG